MNPRETRIQTCCKDRDIFAFARTSHALGTHLSRTHLARLKLPLTPTWYFDRTRTMRGLNLTVFDAILKDQSVAGLRLLRVSPLDA